MWLDKDWIALEKTVTQFLDTGKLSLKLSQLYAQNADFICEEHYVYGFSNARQFSSEINIFRYW